MREESPYPIDEGHWDTRVVTGPIPGFGQCYCFAEVHFVDGHAVFFEPFECPWSPGNDFKQTAMDLMMAMGKPVIDSETLLELDYRAGNETIPGVE